jgi:hypothetical protein
MRSLATGLLLAVALASVGAPASATGLSMNEVELRAGATIDDCKTAGRAAIAQAGLRAMPDSPASVFGSTPSNELIAIYCLPQRGIAIIAVAGSDNQITRPILNRLMGLWSGR